MPNGISYLFSTAQLIVVKFGDPSVIEEADNVFVILNLEPNGIWFISEIAAATK